MVGKRLHQNPVSEFWGTSDFSRLFCELPLYTPGFTISNDYDRLVRIMGIVHQAIDIFKSSVASPKRGLSKPSKRRRPSVPLAVITRSMSAAAKSVKESQLRKAIQASISFQPLQEHHYKQAGITLTKLPQGDRLGDVIRQITSTSSQKAPFAESWMGPAAPFVDNSGILRIGRRLRHSDLPFETKHQALIPARHPLFQSWVMSTHVKYLPAGPEFIRSVQR